MSPGNERTRERGPARLSAAIAGAAMAMALTVAACSPGGSPDTDAGADNTLVIASTMADIPILDTILTNGQGYEGQRFVGKQIWEGLTRYDLQQGSDIPELVPGLATEWEASEDGTSWTFHLRPDVAFHDGTPWNADAAVFNFDRYLNQNSPFYYPALSGATGGIQGITSVTKIDDLTISIDTDEPTAYLPANLDYIYMASPTGVQEYGNEGVAEHPVGTGPFRFESLVRGDRLSLTRNPDYWAGPAEIERLVIRPMPDPTARVAALRAGQVDWVESPLPDDIPGLEATGFQIATNSYDHMWPWVIDTTKPPLDDVRVRQALNYAIDRDALIGNLLHGTAEPLLQVAARSNTAYRDDNNLYGYDPDKAKALLAEAGYPDGISLRLSFPTSGGGNMVPVPMNEALQQQLAEVGIEVSLEPIEWGALLQSFVSTEIPGGADLLNISLTMQDEINWSMWLDSQSIINVGGYANPEYDALLLEAKRTFDDEARADIYARAAELATEDAVWVFIVSDLNPRALAPNVRGFVSPRSWYIDLTTVSVN